MEPVVEARIGSLSWFAGVFWLGLSWAFQGLVRLVLFLHLPNSWAWALLGACQTCSGLAMQCAREAGAQGGQDV